MIYKVTSKNNKPIINAKYKGEDKEFLPEEITGNSFYKPGNNSKENAFKEGLKNLWKGTYKY